MSSDTGGPASLLTLLRAARDERDEDGLVDIRDAARRHGMPPELVDDAATLAEEWGLVGWADADEEPVLRRCGEQYLALRGHVDHAVLWFLPRVIDDLHARRALLRAGTVVVDTFREAISRGRAVEHARECVPVAFGPAVTEVVAINLFAAAVALMVRLSDGEPAGCVGEEVMALELMGQAERWLVMAREEGLIDDDAAEHALTELAELFELFGDADVLHMLEMREPSDAAVARRSARNQWLRVADQRIERWFVPFSDTAPTGYLDEAGDDAPFTGGPIPPAPP